MADDKKGFLLRLPPQLFEQLRRWAEQDMRSINGQIEWLLREAIVKHFGSDPTDAKAAKKKRPSDSAAENPAAAASFPRPPRPHR